jgi:hypothetical protein
MHVQALLSDVDPAVGEPLVEVQIVHGQGGLGEGVPLHALSLPPPVGDGVHQSVLERRFIRNTKLAHPANHE